MKFLHFDHLSYSVKIYNKIRRLYSAITVSVQMHYLVLDIKQVPRAETKFVFIPSIQN